MTCVAAAFGTARSFPLDVDGSSFLTSEATCFDATRESFSPRTKDDGHPSFAT
ncbi:uncharacterized protein SCHCODRAFT_02603927 [Schizophyllum commune H4-8]|uniref:uncharacterized protein n=1 Tax=Schizophyllum commune (strain H4-8 / FGSC 9210) TaxID=578458 RepID=UPI00215F1989|nr:uncharacterized protein SCHCODRAFT_02603927 [Schizophyllum commune H4-8]KAI5899001.1 hypothetical protein SCHCODRAFT_02603927 [Schizophyllum commune H4-8]